MTNLNQNQKMLLLPKEIAYAIILKVHTNNNIMKCKGLNGSKQKILIKPQYENTPCYIHKVHSIIRYRMTFSALIINCKEAFDKNQNSEESPAVCETMLMAFPTISVIDML